VPQHPKEGHFVDQNGSHLKHDPEKRFNGGPQAETLVENSAPLPESYGDNRLVVLARDPLWFFAYWEFTPERIEQARQQAGAAAWDAGTWVLRVYDVSDFEQDGIERAPFFEVNLSPQARQWYVKVERPGRAYTTQFGRRLPDGRFISLLRSNRIRLPLGRVSEKTDSQWMAIGYGTAEEEKWNKLMEAAAGVTQASRGSDDVSKTMAKRWEFLRSVYSGSSLSSGALANSSGYGASLGETPPGELPQ
jgi:hypothetical protein